MEQVQGVANTINSIEEAISADQLLDALGFLRKAEVDLEDFSEHQNTLIRAVMVERIRSLKHTIAGTLREQWNDMIRVDQAKSTVMIGSDSKGLAFMLCT